MNLIWLIWILLLVNSGDGLTWRFSNNSLPVAVSSSVVGYDINAQKIWMLGGWDYQNGWHNELIEYNVKRDNFTIHASLPIYILSTNSETTINNKIYMIVNITSLATFDMTTKQFINPWNNVTIPTVYHSSCLTNIDDKYLMVLGGYNDITYLYSNQMLIYDMDNGVWLGNTKNLPFARLTFSCEVHNDYLYIIGGQRGWNISNGIPIYTNSVQKLYIADTVNTNNYNWMDLPVLSYSLINTRTVIVAQYIYVIGGYGWQDANNKVWAINDNVQRIDTINDIIDDEPKLSYPVSSPGAVICLDRIYVLGGAECPDWSVSCDADHVTNAIQLSTFITINPTSNPSNEPTLEPTTNPLSATSSNSTSPTLKPTTNPTMYPSTNPTTATPTAPPAPRALPLSLTTDPTGDPTTADEDDIINVTTTQTPISIDAANSKSDETTLIIIIISIVLILVFTVFVCIIYFKRLKSREITKGEGMITNQIEMNKQNEQYEAENNVLTGNNDNVKNADDMDIINAVNETDIGNDNKDDIDNDIVKTINNTSIGDNNQNLNDLIANDDDIITTVNQTTSIGYNGDNVKYQLPPVIPPVVVTDFGRDNNDDLEEYSQESQHKDTLGGVTMNNGTINTDDDNTIMGEDDVNVGE